MELTTSYQKIAETYLGTDNYGGQLYVRAYAKYSQQDVQNNRSYVHYEATAHFTGSNIYDQQGNGSIGGTGVNTVTGSATYVQGDITIANTEGWVTHDADGTKSINVTAKLNFPNWGWSATATGSATLPNLHKAPETRTADMVETNADMIALNIPDTTIVKHLSKKQITLHGYTYDDATLTYRIEHFGTNYNIPTTDYQVSNVFNTDYTANDISIDDEFRASIIQKLKDSLNGTATDWVYVSVGGVVQKPDAIPYFKPSLVGTSTTIKRKSGSYSATLQRVANLTDNICSLNLTGMIYKENDIIGNNNLITQIGYKIWQKGTTEPVNYTSLTATVNNNEITITDFEINGVLFTEVYNYKIILADNYSADGINNYYALVEGTIPLGQALWTEYKDHVDFYELTVKRNNPFEYNDTNEIIVGKWIDGSLIYRKVIDFGSLPNNSLDSETHGISNLGQFVKISGVAVRSSDNDTLPIPYVTFNANNTGGIVIYANNTNVYINTSTDRSGYDGYIVLEYTKSS